MVTWIGRIEPSMWLEGAWWEALLPPGVRLAVLSLGVRRLRPDELETAHAKILDCVRELDDEGVDVINVGGSPVVSAYGRDGHERLLQDIAAVTKRPFVTSLQAEIEALRSFGSRVLIASPYPEEQTRRRIRLLAAEGFDVLASSSLGLERNRAIAELDPQVVLAQAVDIARNHPRADVLYLPCGSLPAVEIIEQLEQKTRLPVVTNVVAQLHAALARAGHLEPIPGHGQLLATRTGGVPTEGATLRGERDDTGPITR
jgi:maleate isomerase